MTRSSRLPREGLERAAHELAGLSLTTTELEALLGRLKSIREALGALQARIGTGCGASSRRPDRGRRRVMADDLAYYSLRASRDLLRKREISVRQLDLPSVANYTVNVYHVTDDDPVVHG